MAGRVVGVVVEDTTLTTTIRYVPPTGASWQACSWGIISHDTESKSQVSSRTFYTCKTMSLTVSARLCLSQATLNHWAVLYCYCYPTHVETNKFVSQLGIFSSNACDQTLLNFPASPVRSWVGPGWATKYKPKLELHPVKINEFNGGFNIRTNIIWH